MPSSPLSWVLSIRTPTGTYSLPPAAAYPRRLPGKLKRFVPAECANERPSALPRLVLGGGGQTALLRARVGIEYTHCGRRDLPWLIFPAPPGTEAVLPRSGWGSDRCGGGKGEGEGVSPGEWEAG
ncbi:hypothetical protein F5X99DRAFT_407214 [Biscogniauxia marginata]|nr:hypothetical protein F5X99DRAFT_407214 [Biscogniauxia marginata]